MNARFAAMIFDLQNFNWKVIISCVFIAAAAVALLIFIKRFTKKRLKKKRLGKDKRTLNSFYGIVSGLFELAVIIIAVISILQICGINVTSLVAGLGIAGAVVGLALQDIMKDVIMGIHIASDSFFDIGDGVLIDGKEGIVLRFNMKTTAIQFLDDKSVCSVCNRDIESITKLPEFFDIDVPLGYDTEKNTAETVLKQCSGRIEKDSLVGKCEYIGIQSFDDSNIKYRLRITCDIYRRAEARRKALSVIMETLSEEGIRIPFNQLDVHVDGLK